MHNCSPFASLFYPELTSHSPLDAGGMGAWFKGELNPAGLSKTTADKTSSNNRQTIMFLLVEQTKEELPPRVQAAVNHKRSSELRVFFMIAAYVGMHRMHRRID